MGRRSKWIFLQRRHIDGQQSHEKTFAIANHQRNTKKKKKTTIRYQLIPVRMAIIKRSTNNKGWRECKEKGTLLHSWQECKLVQPLWRIVWRFLKKLKMELPYDPAIQFLGIYLDKTIIQKDTCTPMFLATLVTIAKTWKQSKCPSIDE